ncbi:MULTISPECIES: hypothetical protein [unclassified Microcoleus]
MQARSGEIERQKIDNKSKITIFVPGAIANPNRPATIEAHDYRPPLE